jgi:outer membrane receptor for ferric coprogen and ferric-rhodotorulic acid
LQWAADLELAVLEPTPTHLEPVPGLHEERGLAASAIDRRLSTTCSFYRFAHSAPTVSTGGAGTSTADSTTPSRGHCDSRS